MGRAKRTAVHRPAHDGRSREVNGAGARLGRARPATAAGRQLAVRVAAPAWTVAGPCASAGVAAGKPTQAPRRRQPLALCLPQPGEPPAARTGLRRGACPPSAATGGPAM